MEKPTKDQVKEALETIIAYGRERYMDEIKDSVDRGRCFGQGVSAVIDDPNFMFAAAGEHAEDWNYHPEAEAVRGLIK